MAKTRSLLDLNRVDWAEVGEIVCTIIVRIKANPTRFEDQAATLGGSLEGLMAAAITQIVKEHLEKKAKGNSQSQKRRPRRE